MTASLSAAERARLDGIEAAPPAPESWFPDIASEGPHGPEQVSHRARPVPGSYGRSVTGCGIEFGGDDTHPDWATWGVSGGLVGDEWPEITCPRCPQPIRPLADALAAIDRVLALATALAEEADAYRHAAAGTFDDGARKAHYAIARRIRGAVAGTPEAGR
jgi:hypothetical protein